MQFFDKTNIDFVGKRSLFFVVSSVVIVLGLVGTLLLGVSYGIDFDGGTEIGIGFSGQVETNELRATVEKAGFQGAEIKSFGKENQFLIRVKESADAPKIIQQALETKYSSLQVETLKVDKIGPKIGKESRTDALFAVVLSVIAILLYVGFRFEFSYGLGAIVALAHDVLVTFAVIVIVNKTGLINLEINQTILAGMLTVVGFSINDTVIIFDRIRENKEKLRGKKFTDLVNASINETLSRTINTVLTTALVLLALVLFGGPVLEGFAFTMLIGIITGTYSSIYIASSFVIWYLVRNNKIDAETGLLKKEATAQ